jgi:hypothetical protein
VSDLSEVFEFIDQQCSAYRAMFDVGLQQRDCIEREDLTGLETAFARMQVLMDQVRLRQRQLPDLHAGGPEVVRRVAVMRKLICEIEDQRRHAQEGAERLLAQARAEMRQMAKGRRAHRGYQVEIPGQSRLFDGMR